MKIILQPGEKVSIEFADSDGEITVDFNSKGDNCLRVETEWPDTQGRQGVIYEEDYSTPPGKEKA